MNNILDVNKTMFSTTLKPIIALNLEAKSTTIFESKLGGIPYFPKNIEYPRSEDGLPLKLLAQINFEEIPFLEGFPQTGIIQFYINIYDNFYGLDFKNPISQKNFRVIYHDKIDMNETSIYNIPEFPKHIEESFPINGEFKLSGAIKEMPLTLYDFRFDEKYISIFNTKMEVPINDTSNLSSYLNEYEYDTVFKDFGISGSHLGGYPYFTQEDPRNSYGFEDYSVLLFQLDSYSNKYSQNSFVLWGDNGIGNFFITPEQLKNLDFTKVLYNWDCY